MRRFALLFIALVLVPATTLPAAELPAAADLLKKVQAAPSPATAPDPANDPAWALKKDIGALSRTIATMPPAQAAEAWLKLFDRYADAPHAGGDAPRRWRRGMMIHRSESSAGGVTFADLLSALPPPAAWDDLAKAIASRPAPAPPEDNRRSVREKALRVFAAVLAGKADANDPDVEKLLKVLIDRDPRDSRAAALAEAVSEQKPADLVANFETAVDRWTVGRGNGRLDVPDLVTLAGAQKAEALLRKAVVLPNVELDVEVGEETKTLARKVALAEMDNVKAPQWQLCRALGSDVIALYEATEKKFVSPSATQPAAGAGAAPATQAGGGFLFRLLGGVPEDDNPFVNNQNDSRRTEAMSYYLLALVLAGRTDDAIAQAKKMPPEQVQLSYGALAQLEEGGNAAAVQAFVHRLLSDDPDLPLWDNYVALSTKVGKSDEMLALARKAAARKDLDPKRAAATRRQLAKALLAADQIDEGVAMLRESIADQLKVQNADGNEGETEAFASALLMARVGKLLGRDALVDEGIKSANGLIEARAAKQNAGNDYELRQAYQQLAALLEEIGRAPQAVELLASGLASARRPNNPNVWSSDARDLAIELLGIYHRAGRHADVLALLETLPVWNASDLAEIYPQHDEKGTPVGYMAAAALADAKRENDARKVVNAVLDQTGGFDPAYQLLIKLDGPRAALRFDELFARDQFEERPLIWKATLMGMGDASEAIIRQAISIDPSDGEQGKGTRMRAYSVLADVLEKKGDAEQAKIYRGAVKAIRVAEDADDWWEAGLLTRAIKQYEEALTHFQDAYCIQSRLALRMAEMGFTEKAEEHYRKAYELMPDSFGRMESHCFGCEGAFRGSSARKIAEQVFARLVEKQPKKPQVHYLLGYLREQEGRYKEALPPMQQAVKLDPDYLNAWKHIQDLARSIYLAPELRDAAALNLMRLDPLGRHVNSDVSTVRDLRSLWDVAAKAAALRTTPPRSLMPLPASAAEVRKLNPEQADALRLQAEQAADESPATPGAALAGTRIVSTIGEILDAH